jgi:hypothetical protein
MITAASYPASQGYRGAGMLGTKSAGAVGAHHELFILSASLERHSILRAGWPRSAPLY